MTKMVKVTYWLSEAGQKNSLLAGGDGKHEQVFETPATERLIKMAKVSWDGEMTLEVKIGKPRYKITNSYPKVTGIGEIDGNCCQEIITGVERPSYSYSIGMLLDEPQTIDSILAKYDAADKLFWDMEKAIPEENKKLEYNYKKRLAEVTARYEKKQAEAVAIEAERVTREQEKADWIMKYGSDYLKDCLELDVKANLEYVVERANIEFPGYVVDYTNNTSWGEKFSPSKEALSELRRIRGLGVEALIVWLTSPAQVRKEDNDDCEYDYRDKYEPCEAVVIRNYLGKYDLAKTF